ncbi:succinate dehydrogenase assembly factor 2, mitochondrial-like [Sipha flava]|uniref:Succinate dehydrogenase assembly factor 2, mitochondrial n=1 Tax=Sipha flava TaxID=143950 RepID=A0A8B8G5U0_9HEMI|nr:succinate dehydrogenase assembly factor 2, mitochondrial-like [Sipha flava]
MLNQTVYFCRNSIMRNTHLLISKTRNYAQVSNTKNVPDSNINLMRNRLIYQSRKRGTLENCIIFTTFADRYLKTFDQAQLQKYDALINSRFDEWELYAWAIGSKPAPQEFDNEIMSLLKNHINRNYSNKK